MATIFVIIEESQDDHGYVDKDVVEAVTTEAEAEARVTTYEDAALKKGERVCGRVDEWDDPHYLCEPDESDWNTCFTYEAVELIDAPKETTE